MAAGAGTATVRSLEQTPTWALATVCFIFIFVSIFIEHLIHLLCHWLKRHRKTALFEAVEKLKSVLMGFGFMSLILTVTQGPVSKICIPTKVANIMLPCRKSAPAKITKALSLEHIWISTTQNPLPSKYLFADHLWAERSLAEAASSGSDHCESKGKTSLISSEGLNQLSIFIFVLAVMHIVYSVLTMALGRAKMRRWKAWEKETLTVEYQAANDPNRFRFIRQTTFARRHTSSCTRSTLELWTKCFFRQFFCSVAKVDYLTLRHGFISAHLSTNNSFNFQKYIQRSLDDDFKVVVGIRPFMWIAVVIFLFLDMHGWHIYLWVSFLPLTIVLVLGTKMEVIVANMALKLQDQTNVIKGTPLVQPSDNFFWFGHPEYILDLLHFTLFMNAFELAFFIWVTVEFGIKSCYHEDVVIIVVRMVLAVTVQVMCSYITLPLYALVTQMGSQLKKAVLEDQTANVLKQWHAEVKKRKKREKQQSGQELSSITISSSSRTISSSPEVSLHQRAPTFSEMTKFPSQTEIEENP
ncbi:MLO-like protein [Quillaja saponaria]|uniref:MLO-like protein n=1 Tax=Quillaja saponaria TaxID=32244 RepID=A0AAD7PA20_QUISA|nr:MLO-like protein [Quillaja saponaria]